ncbi:YceD family protein [Bacillus shivajii]|uniref:YceD family protein n=1 Tax=Bacillus shivajii TaxID=1983719 RepID=UPI001CF99FCC|nr:YceD family protein [Bacillus shivajii]UCZ51841.1 YceD family protein [Bacillus shivajii]
MKWSVQQLVAFKEKGLHVEESVDVSQVKEIDREIRDITPVQVKGDAIFSSHSVMFNLEISGKMVLPCARTLNDVEYPFTINASETFKLDQWATFEEDEEVHELEDNTVDLLPYVKERILLEKPMQVFSDKEEGPAPQSGKGWELKTKEEEKEKIDPRLKELEKFFDKK